MLKPKRTFIVAEVSASHGQNLERAICMVKKAKECGADAVKFQTYTPDTLTINAKNKYFRVKHPRWGGQTLYQLYKKAYTPWRWLEKLKKTADREKIIFFSTAFDKTSIDFLEKLDVPAHKIASFELTDLPLIEYAATKKKLLILSTGMASFQEIKEATSVARRAGAKNIILLKCVSNYPASPDSMNLKTIQHMEKAFKCTIGLSDHTMGIAVSVAAVALGAKIIEKHFTLSRRIKSPDSFFSIEPNELKELVIGVRTAERALGKICYGTCKDEAKNRIFRRSLFVVENIRKGESFTEKNVRPIRPGYGLPPKYLKYILKKKAVKKISKGTPLRKNLIDA